MLNELAESIATHQQFLTDFARLERRSLEAQVIPDLAPPQDEDIGWLRKLLESAIHLAGSESVRHRQLAYRCAVGLLRTSLVDFSNARDLLSFVLTRVGNFPAEAHLRSKMGSPTFDSMPVAVYTERTNRIQANTVNLPGERQIAFTDFQVRVWSAAVDGAAVAIAAPTSAGKSFALQQYVCAAAMSEGARNFIYIVPTRALISQVSAGLNKILDASGEAGVGLLVSSIPISPLELGEQRAIYVLTQERLQILLDTIDARTISTVAIDEAQLVSQGSRGIILQSVLERIWAAARPKLLFSSPASSEVGIYQDMLRLPRLTSLRGEEPAVAQNLIQLTLTPARDAVVVSSIGEGFQGELGTVRMPFELVDDRQMYAATACVFGRQGSSLVYASGPGECERLAALIRDCAIAVEGEDVAITDDQDVADFVDVLRTHVHPEYPLIDAVQARVGFHYGNMPTIVRLGVEKLFDDGKLKYLVCTSTLLHGVNFPAKNLFMFRPTRGEDSPLAPDEFWNLAGRAGRLGREFEGNVFLIERHRWDRDPVQEPAVVRADWPVVGELRDGVGPLVEAISGREKRIDANKEAAAAKLYHEYVSGRWADTRPVVTRGAGENGAVAIETAIAEAAQRVTLPTAILEQHSTIVPIKQQEMFNYLVGKIEGDDLEGIIPLHPLQADVYTSLLRLFKRFHNIFEGLPRNNNSHRFFAALAREWMRGYPLRRLIQEYMNRHPTTGAPTAIRSVMESVEKELRFRYVKFSRCYSDLLKLALGATGNEGEIPRIPAIPLYLELGACSGTMVVFVGMGLSRTTAALLTEQAINKSMTRTEALIWLQRNDAARRALPRVCQHEIATVLRGL